MKTERKKIKSLVKEINHHIEMATVLTNELNEFLGRKPLPFDGIGRIDIEDILPHKKEKKKSIHDIEFDEIEKGEIISYSAFDELTADDEY